MPQPNHRPHAHATKTELPTMFERWLPTALAVGCLALTALVVVLCLSLAWEWPVGQAARSDRMESSFAAVAAPTAGQAGGPSTTTWWPELAPAIAMFEELAAAIEQQQPMNAATASLAALHDAHLYILFQHYLGRLPEAGRPAARSEQDIFLAERDKLAHRAHEMYAGGSLASYSASQAFISSTRRRAKVIEQRLDRQP